jgi:hypothetical protein
MQSSDTKLNKYLRWIGKITVELLIVIVGVYIAFITSVRLRVKEPQLVTGLGVVLRE